ncbi:MAG: peptidoglycan endopeptidase [Verrucomicrobiota bacterium]
MRVFFLLWVWTVSAWAGELLMLGEDGRVRCAEEAPEEMKRVVAAANALVGKGYKWGGGHAECEDEGYDCSGAVSFVLREAGLMEGARSSRGFFDFGEEGEGVWLTIWVRKGHVFLEVGGLRFDTLGQDAEDGPRWFGKGRELKRFEARSLEGR